MFLALDWIQPWYRSVRSTAELIRNDSLWINGINDLFTRLKLTNHRGLPLSLIDQAALPQEVAYESFISETGQIPTRNNLHDFFNALVWLTFPKIKQQLNALQASQIASQGIRKSRGSLRDAATLFDENAAFLVISNTPEGHEIMSAIQQHEWFSAFIDQREKFGHHAELWLFGHALMEKLSAPYKSITAHAWTVLAPSNFFSMNDMNRKHWLDKHISNALQMQKDHVKEKPWFTPLPVLGVPGWWTDQDHEFYADTKVFRPKKLKHSP